MITWKDVTIYSRGKDRIPHWWSAILRTVNISIGNSHRDYPGDTKWFLNCHPWFDTYVLKADNLEDAKAEALELVLQKAAMIVNEIGGK